MKKLLFCLLLALSLSSAQAQFFGGYGDGVTNVSVGYNTGPWLRLVYDDFTFDAPGDINGLALFGRNNTGGSVALYYEIRSGMSEGDGGTVVLSGTWAGSVFSASGLGTPGPGTGTYGRYSASVGDASALHLAAGTYWIGLAPLESFGSLDLSSTVGLGSVGHPINNGNAFYYNSDGSANYVSLGDHDFGFEISTLASTAPEPSTTALLSVCLTLGCFLRRFRR